MEMSDNEIIMSYKSAKSKTKQIEILADLNCCDKQKIVNILTTNGIQIYGKVKHNIEKDNIIINNVDTKKTETKKEKVVEKQQSLKKEQQSSDDVTYLELLFNKNNVKYIEDRLTTIDNKMAKLQAEKTFLSSVLDSYKKYMEDTKCQKGSSKVDATTEKSATVE